MGVKNNFHTASIINPFQRNVAMTITVNPADSESVRLFMFALQGELAKTKKAGKDLDVVTAPKEKPLTDFPLFKDEEVKTGVLANT